MFARLKLKGKIKESLLLLKNSVDHPKSSNSSVAPLMEISENLKIGQKGKQISKLSQFNSAVFSIPKGFLLWGDLKNPETIKFLKDKLNEKKSYIVRSNAFSESGNHNSQAGRFHSEPRASKEKIEWAVEKVGSSLPQSSSNNSVIVQEYLEFDYSGSLFTKSPQNEFYSVITYTKGQPDHLHAGKSNGNEAFIGRYSNEIKSEHPDLNTMFKHINLSGRLIETHFQNPQEIEWGYHLKKSRLFILQSRKITAANSSSASNKEMERLLERLNRETIHRKLNQDWEKFQHPDLPLTTTPLSTTLIENFYNQKWEKKWKNFESLKDNSYMAKIFSSFYRCCEKKNLSFHTKKIISEFKLKNLLKSNHKTLLAPFIELIETSKTDGRTSPSALLNFCLDDLTPALYLLNALSQLVEENPALNIAPQISEQMRASLPPSHLGLNYVQDLIKLSIDKNMDSFISNWGHRKMNDYELREPTFSENPQSALDFSLKYSNLPEIKNSSFPDSLSTLFLSLRETLKNILLKNLSELRHSLLNYANEIKASDDCLFFLELNELKEILDSPHSENKEYLLKIATERKDLFKNYRPTELSSKITLSDLEFSELETKTDLSTNGKLKGKFISKKIHFKGKTHHISDHSTLSNSNSDEMIIVSKNFSQYLVPHFANAKGIIVENGSLGCHAAVIARKYGIPAIVLKNAVSLFPDNCDIEVMDSGHIKNSQSR